MWRDKVEHIWATMNNNHESDGEHLFAFPFHTTANLLMSCFGGLMELNDYHIDQVHHNVVFSKNMKTDPVVITTTPVRSLSTGVYINEDIMISCLKW